MGRIQEVLEKLSSRSARDIASSRVEISPVSPTILGIFTAPKAGASMERRSPVLAVKGLGLLKDRYFHRKGAFSVGDKEINPNKPPRVPDDFRQVSFISKQALDEANQILAHMGIKPFTAEETRRNVFLDIPSEELNTLVGKRFRIGKAVFEVVEQCNPCTRPALVANRSQDAKAFDLAFKDKGGIRARVIETGLIQDGDKLFVL